MMGRDPLPYSTLIRAKRGMSSPLAWGPGAPFSRRKATHILLRMSGGAFFAA